MDTDRPRSSPRAIGLPLSRPVITPTILGLGQQNAKPKVMTFHGERQSFARSSASVSGALALSRDAPAPNRRHGPARPATTAKPPYHPPAVLESRLVFGARAAGRSKRGHFKTTAQMPAVQGTPLQQSASCAQI